MSLEAWKSFFEIGGVVLLAATFVFGAGALIVNNRINVIASRELDDFKLRFEGEQQKTAHAQQEAAEAKALAGGFEKDIAIANKAAAEANERATKAQANLALAERQAAEANAKAESSRLDIAKANEGAAQAQAQVAGAMAEAAKANLDLQRIRTPRSLVNAAALTESLRTFNGTEYVVIGCFQDQDSVNLLVQLDKALEDAGWKRGKLPQGSAADIQLNIAKDFAVPITTRSGVYVGAQSTETIDTLKETPAALLPEYIRAAMALKGGLASGIDPPEGDFGPLPVDPGNSTSVFILIGKKP